MIKTDKTQIKELWKECFDDSDEFIDLYFRLRYNNEVSVYFKSANQVITALQMLPYPFTYQGKVCSSSYISGACTHPEYRNIGAMRGLISEAFARMAKKNVAISTLIPADDWLFDYYGSMGYTTIFYCHESEVDTSSLPPSTGDTLTTDEFRKDFYEYYRRNMLKRDCCVQHTERDVRIILADMKIDHGFVVVALRERTVVGVAFVYLNEGAFYVADMIAETDRVKLQLLQAVHERDESLKIFLLSAPEPDGENTPLGMVRIIDAHQMLQLYAEKYPDAEMLFYLKDDILSSNSGYYHLFKGKCNKSDKRLQSHLAKLTKMNMKELAMFLFKDKTPYMSMMMD
jgi:predicted acetyltransferase